jgi:DNA repair protein SbcC/Rad50
MIQRIELWDFESHEHTVIDDISPELNLLCGESNSGKTSVIRALKLAAYNEFDPKSVRTGCTKCVVEVTTEKGIVKVTRGEKCNLWETTRTGGKTQYFDKVGVKIVPEAEAIIGLNIVTLGDVEVPVNIMDQLESHFLLSGVGNKDASGSMRAQIVDEISGLSGIEGLIKEVSLDHHRYGRAITETEKAMEAVRAQLHPESILNAEEALLESAEKELKDYETMVALADDGDTIITKWEIVSRSIQDCERALLAIPDTDVADIEISRAGDLLARAESAATLHRDCVVAEDRLNLNLKKLSGIPDVPTAASFINQHEAASRALVKAEEVLNAWTTAMVKLESKQTRERELIKALTAETEIASAKELIDRVDKAERLLFEGQRLQASLLGLQTRLENKDKELKEAEKERDELLASIKTCPLSLRPVSKECLA